MILTQRESLPHNCGTQPRCRAANAKPVATCRQSQQYPAVLHHHYHYYLNCCRSGREEDGTMEDEAAFVKCLLQHQLSHCHGQPAKEPSTQQRCCSTHPLRKSASDISQQHISQRGAMATVDTRTNKTQSPPSNVLREATNQPHGTASPVKAPPTRKEVSTPSWKRDLDRIFAEVEERSQHPIQVYRMLLYESVRESEFLRKELRRSQDARTDSQCTAQRLLAEVKELEHVIRKLTVRSHRDDDAKHTSKELSELHRTVQGRSKEPTEEKSPQTTNKKRTKDLLQVLSEKQESEVRSTAEPATLMAEKHYQREGAAAVNVSPITKREELISAQSSSCDFYLRIPLDRVEMASVPSKTGVSSAKRQPSSRKSEGDNHSSSESTSSASQYAVPSNYSPSPSPAPVNEATNVPDCVAEDSPAANVGAKVNFVADLVSPIAADGADPHPSLLMPPPSFRAQPSGSASSGRHTGSTSNSGSKAATSRSSPSVQLPPQPHDYSTFMISTFTSGSSPHTQESSGSRSSHPASLKAAEEVVLPADRSFTKVDHEASPPAHAVVEIPVEDPQPLLTHTEDRAHLQPSVVGVKDEASGSATSTTDVTMRRRGDLDTSAASSGPSYIFIPDVGDSQHHDLPVRAPISAGDLLNGSEGSFSLLDAHPRAAPYRVTAARSNSRLRSASTSLRTSSIIGELSFSSTTTSSTISTVDRARR